MSTNNIGEKIAQLRKQHNMTQEQLADKLGVTGQAVSKWETGVTCPDISLLPLLSKVFFISVDELLGVEKKTVMVSPNENTSNLMIHIRILSSDSDKVNIKLPFSIISKAIIMNIGGITGNGALNNIDWKQLAEAVNMGLRGKIIDIQSSDGDIVEIIIE